MPTESSSNSADASIEHTKITVRTAPKFVPFLVAGGVLGIIVAAISAYGFQTPQSLSNPVRSYDAGTVFGFLAVLFAGVGVILGSILALILDRVGRKNARIASVRPLTAEENAAADAAGED